MRARLLAVAVAGALTLGPAACTDEGDQDAYCDRIASVPDVQQILSSLDASDPGGLESSIEEALAEFRALEAEAPGRIKADVARLRQGVELVLEAVRDNPGDLPGARQDILAETDELSGLAQAGSRVAADAEAECDLTGFGQDSRPATEPDTGGSTTEGGDDTTTAPGTGDGG
ncbi:MAG TPA: hypothetical protein VEW93_07965 [Acidimicrobiales bacterium]|nr:hypothetical protein [Acidimicrobiales bacterium]